MPIISEMSKAGGSAAGRRSLSGDTSTEGYQRWMILGQNFLGLILLTTRDSSRDFRSPPTSQPGGHDFKGIHYPYRLNDRTIAEG